MVIDNSDKIKNRINSYEYVSFDIFDTLLKRDVKKPTDLFLVMQNQLVSTKGELYKDFANKRKLAERQARDDLKREITLQEIYDYLSNSGYPSIDGLMEMEQSLEVQFCTPNPLIWPVYQSCLEQGKHIIIISDMYLPRVTIKKMLEKIGVTTYDYLFISNEIGKTKAKGDLFSHVLSELNLNSDQLIHIGDNNKSDIRNANQCGINAIEIPTWINSMRYYQENVEGINEQVLQEFINNRVKLQPKETQLGYETMGPMLYGFVTWLYQKLKQQGAEKVFFLARDGLIIKRAFEKLPQDDIKGEYLYASRRVFQIPLLSYDDETFECYLTRLHWPQQITLDYFLYSLGIDTEEIKKKIINRYNINGNTGVSRDDLSENELFKRIFNDFRNEIKVNALNERNTLVSYLKSIGCEGNIILVDIGWHGNMQANLIRLLNKVGICNSVKGYYVGIKPHNNLNELITMDGYAFNDNKNEDLYIQEREVNSLFEEIFMANHGSIKKLIKDKYGKFIPDTYEFEQTDPNAISVIKNYQQGALKLVEDFGKLKGIIPINSRFSINNVLNQFNNPKFEDVLVWGNIIFRDQNDRPLVADSLGIKYILHLKQFLADYKSSVWKIGFLKQNIRLNLNYYKIAEIIRIYRTRKLKGKNER